MKSMTTRIIVGIAAAGLALSVAGCSSGETASAGSSSSGEEATTPVKFNWGVPTSAYIALYVAEDQGYFTDEGLDPNFQSFQSGAPLLAGLESDSLDIGTSGLASVFALGQGIDIRMFGFEGDGAYTIGLVGRDGGSIHGIEDLGNGAPVGIATGTCAQTAAYFAAQKAGIDYDSINVVDIAPNLFANSFESSSIDAGISWSPYIFDLQSDSGASVLAWDAEYTPGEASCPQTHYGRSAFLDEHPDVPVKIVRALERAWADIREDPEVAVTSLLARLGGSEDTVRATVEGTIKVQPTIEQLASADDVHGFVGSEGIVRQLDLASQAFADLGVIPEPLSAETLQKAVDPTAVKTVAAEQ